MESPQLAPSQSEQHLRRGDLALLLLLCAVLYGFSVLHQRVLTTHETVHCLNVREMFASGDWLIPTYGERPWLERPPLPHWLTGIFAATIGDMTREWPMRLGSIVVATLAVLVFASATARCFGRNIGLMSGAILATMREFATYATEIEADIFLASAVTIVGALFLRIQFASDASQRRPSFFGRRPLGLMAFFLLLGLTNWMKGPLFGMIFILLPMAGYFLWNRQWRETKPYVWFWGWLVLLAAGASWPLVAYARYPDVVDLWLIDYGVRWRSGYIGEPWWYYFVQQPWNVFPWTLCAAAGLIATAGFVWHGQSKPLRFVWCWALLPVLFFSLFKGKHHHYLLSCLAPAAVLGAYGAVFLWERMTARPGWVRSPWFAVAVIGIPGSLLLVVFGGKIPGPIWARWALALGWPAFAALIWWVVTRPQGQWAFVAFCATVVATDCLATSLRMHYLNNYTADRTFIEETKVAADPATPLFVVFDEHPLTSSWFLYYLGERARLLHNVTFLRDDRISAAEVYVVCRQSFEAALTEYGAVRPLVQSFRTRGESSAADRFTLYHVRFHPNLVRTPAARISPLQATGRQPGPFLGRPLVTADSGN